MSLVYPPYIYIGSQKEASARGWLIKHKIKHILNATIDIHNRYPLEFNYLTIPIDDSLECDLNPYLQEAFDFIDQAVNNKEYILVHCVAGVSRSASLVIYYLIKEYKLTYQSSFKTIRKVRSIVYPNPNFKRQLLQFETEQID